jgi:hypothetical protein
MTVFIHIGTPKTGTTSIQHAMFRNAEVLRREYSINYPTVELNHWAIMVPYTTKKQYKPLRNRSLRRLGSDKRFMQRGKVYASDLTRDATLFRTHVISSEQLLSVNPEALAALRGFFAGLGLETKIVVYVRHPAEWISSMISTELRGGATDLKSLPIVDDTTPALRNYSEVFGKENITIRRFGERYFLNGDLIDDFTAVINGVPIKGLNAERLNESLSVPAIMLAEHLYAVAPLSSGRRANENYLTQIAGPKFRAPRWMVEKAIEAHREGMNYLDSEFGIRFHDVDLSAFPETLSWDFPPEALASVARILNEQSLRIEALSRGPKRLRWHRRARSKIRELLGAN